MPIQIKSGSPIKIFTENEVKSKPLNYSDAQAKLELFLADKDAKEHTRQIGLKCEYFQLSIKDSPLNPTYAEPIAHKFSKPFILYMYVAWPNPEFMVRDDGSHTVFITHGWMARKEAEDVGLNAPRPGDIIHFWDIPFFNEQAANGRVIEGAGMYLDVIEVKDDGHLYDSPYFVGFKLDLKRRTEFGPERKLTEFDDLENDKYRREEDY